MGARSSGDLRKARSSPWFDDRNALLPVIVKVAATAGSCRINSSARSWRSRISVGDEPSRPIMTPQTKLLSPTGKNDLGTTMKSQIVPARQTTQINADTQRKRRNHQSDLPYMLRT